MAAEEPSATGSSGGQTTALTNVRVFDGHGYGEPGTVVVEDGLIGTGSRSARVVDGHGGVLLPGLIDAHVHLSGLDTLERLSGYGITTALDTGAWPPALVDSLPGRRGLLAADPLADIAATRQIEQVWCAGVERLPR